MLLRFLALLLVASLAAADGSAAAPNADRIDGAAEARLVQVYKSVGAGDTRRALLQAQTLVRDFPHFQLAQLVYGDLLLAHPAMA